MRSESEDNTGSEVNRRTAVFQCSVLGTMLSLDCMYLKKEAVYMITYNLTEYVWENKSLLSMPA